MEVDPVMYAFTCVQGLRGCFFNIAISSVWVESLAL